LQDFTLWFSPKAFDHGYTACGVVLNRVVREPRVDDQQLKASITRGVEHR